MTKSQVRTAHAGSAKLKPLELLQLNLKTAQSSPGDLFLTQFFFSYFLPANRKRFPHANPNDMAMKLQLGLERAWAT